MSPAGPTPFLMYHELARPGRPLCSTDPGYVRYVVAESDFRAQMAHIVASGQRGVGVSAWLAGDAAFAERSVVLTFDDGCETDLVAAAPILREHGFGATCYLTVAYLDRPGYLTREQVRELVATGIEVGSHSMSHAYLSDIDDAALHREIVESKRELEQIAGTAIRSFSCPGGRHDGRVLPMARLAGYETVTTSQPSGNDHGRHTRMLGRTAILRPMRMDQFAALVSGRKPTAHKWRELALGSAKRMLGNTMYDKLRTALLR